MLGSAKLLALKKDGCLYDPQTDAEPNNIDFEKVWIIGTNMSFYNNLYNKINDYNEYKNFLQDKVHDLFYKLESLDDLREELRKKNIEDKDYGDIIDRTLLREDITGMKYFYELKEHQKVFEELNYFDIVAFVNLEVFSKSLGQNILKNEVLKEWRELLGEVNSNDYVEVVKVFVDYIIGLEENNGLKPEIVDILEEISEKMEAIDNEVSLKIEKFLDKDIKEVVRLINKIKEELKIEPDKIEDNILGQYTSKKNLKYLIQMKSENQENNNDYPNLRLTNAAQMNDPLEGKELLNLILPQDKKFNYSENEDYILSNNYISSATSNCDSLPMWKQYGEDGEGICLVYDTEKYLRPLLDKKSQPTNINLYRMAYIGATLDEGIEYASLNSDNNKNIDICSDIEKIKEIVHNLESKTENTERNYFLLRTVLNYLKTISILFKNKNYKYENEFRFLWQAKDEKDREQISCQIVNEDIYKLYVPTVDRNYNKIPLSYSKVILGPKVLSDYVAPYIKCSNSKIEVKKSSISYR